jgi:hypothetical protein
MGVAWRGSSGGLVIARLAGAPGGSLAGAAVGSAAGGAASIGAAPRAIGIEPLRVGPIPGLDPLTWSRAIRRILADWVSISVSPPANDWASAAALLRQSGL